MSDDFEVDEKVPSTETYFALQLPGERWATSFLGLQEEANLPKLRQVAEIMEAHIVKTTITKEYVL